jgi:hypothetical protein
MRSKLDPTRRPGRPGWHSIIALALGLVVTCPPAWAQSDEVVETLETEERPWAERVPEAGQNQARVIFARANQSMKDGLFAQAAAEYKETLALWDHPGAHYNLGLAQLSLDQPIEAYESLGKALRFGPAPLLGKEKYEQAQRHRERLEKQLARIEVVCEEEGAEVTLNGEHVFTGPGRYEAMVRPGGHQLVASKVARLTATELAVLSPGDHGRYELVLVLPPFMAAERRWAAWKPWVVVGAGAIVVAGASYLDYHSSQAFDRFDAEFDRLCRDGCPGDEVPRALRDELAGTEREQRVAQVSYAVGGAVLITGVALVYANRERLVRRSGQERKERAARVSPRPAIDAVLRPVFTPGLAGLQAELRF